MFGSLNEFMDGGNRTFQIKPLIDQQQAISPISKYSRRKLIQSRKKRTMSGVQNYKASDKSLLFQKFTKNFPQAQKAIKDSFISKQKQISLQTPQRRKISQSRVSSLFYGNNPLKMKDDIAKQQLKRQHNLLRAIVRTKLNQQQKVANTEYQDSFNRMVANLKKIKIRAVYQDQPTNQRQNQKQPKTNRSLQISHKKSTKSRLDNQTRLQFQNCLNWTKKRKKDGSFYAGKLGKNGKIQVNNTSFQNRKSMLQFIHQRRSDSVGSSFVN